MVSNKLQINFHGFADEPLKDRFSFIDSVLYPTEMDIFLKWVAIPIVVGVVYILAYPYPAKWFYKYSLNRQRELRDARHEVEKATVLSEEDSQRLRAYYYDRERVLQNKIQDQQERIEQLSSKIQIMENNRRPEELAASRAEKLYPQKLTLNEAAVLEAFRDWDDQKKSGYLTELYLDNYLRERGAPVPFSDLKIILADLTQARYLQNSGANAEGIKFYSFTDEGRRAFKEYQEKSADPLK